MIVAALGCSQRKEAQEIALSYGQVIFGSMDGAKLVQFLTSREQQGTLVYFYETG